MTPQLVRICAMATLLALAGCGQMGPLYLPEDAPQTPVQTPSTDDEDN